MKEEKKNALESENSSIWYDGVYIRRAPSNYYIVQIFESPLFDIKMASTGQRNVPATVCVAHLLLAISNTGCFPVLSRLLS